MADNFSYLSILTQTLQQPAGNFAYVKILNPDFALGGGGTGGNTTLSSLVSSVVNQYISNVTVTGGYVAPARSEAWSALGVWVGTGSPSSPVQHSQWLAGSNTY